MCANGVPHRKFVPREEAKSPTIIPEVLLDTIVFDAYEYSKVVTFGIPRACLQTILPKDKFTILLMEVKFVDIVCGINPEYKHHFRFKDGRKAFIYAFSSQYMGLSSLLYFGTSYT